MEGGKAVKILVFFQKNASDLVERKATLSWERNNVSSSNFVRFWRNGNKLHVFRSSEKIFSESYEKLRHSYEKLRHSYNSVITQL